MKRYIILIAAVVAAASIMAQTPIEQVLHNIAVNNNGIKAVRENATADRIELSAENCLENPSLEFEYLWGEKQIPGGNKYAFAVMQGFDFPSLYAQRRKLINAQSNLGEWQVRYALQNTLLQARELCVKLVYLNKQIALVNERVGIADTLAAMYNSRLQAGDANRLEVNKVEIEQLSQKTRLRMLQSERQVVVSSLIACNGGQPLPVAVEQIKDYPHISLPATEQEAIAAWQQSDASTQMLRNQQQVAETQVNVSRQGWIPRFEVGYKQAYEVGDMFYGLAVGVSLPLFKTNNEVKVARARALAMSWQAEENVQQISAEASQLYHEAVALQKAIDDYVLLDNQDNQSLLLKALQSGQISLLEYMADMAQLNDAIENKLLLEYEYNSKLSQLNRTSLYEE